MALAISAPVFAGSREQARHMVEELPHDLSRVFVAVDCRGLEVSTPSFMDELIKAVLVERGALGLLLENARDRTRTIAERCARNRGVHERVQVLSLGARTRSRWERLMVRRRHPPRSP